MSLAVDMLIVAKRGMWIGWAKFVIGLDITLEILALIAEVEDMRLAEVDIMVDQVQAFSGLEKGKARHFLRENLLILARIRRRIHHQAVKAFTALIGDGVPARLPLARSASCWP